MTKLLQSLNLPTDLKNLDKDQLIRLCVEIRSFLLEKVSKNGGHLSSNLGIVELTTSLHRIFDSPTDKIIFDVGHQGYVHKILTGRMEEFDSLRQFGGMSGFLKKSESDHDSFDAGHSSTSISVALGFAKARKILNQQHEIVAVIGDGSMTGGMAFEALNYVGHSKDKIIIVLNDNEMSISENVGGLSKYLGTIRTSKPYFKLKNDAHKLMDHLPLIGKPMVHGIRRIKGSVKHFFIPGIFFEDLGLTYIGPVNGHLIEEMDHAFKRAKQINGPVLVHVLTKKGKGYKKAEEAPGLYHGVGKFDVIKGICDSNAHSFSDVFGCKLIELAQNDPKIVAITAAMPTGTGLHGFKERFPERYFDVGIAEQNAVTMAAGMALQGLKPVFAVYSTFLQRAYDQILHDVCIQNLPVIFAVDRAGLVGQDGETHHGMFDIAYLSHIPNMVILAPADEIDLKMMMTYALTSEKIGPIAIRYPRGSGKLIDSSYDHCHTPGIMYDPYVIQKNSRSVILSFGHMLKSSLEVSEILKNENILIDVINVKSIEKSNINKLIDLCQSYDQIFTVEDGVIMGGFGHGLTLLSSHPNINILALPNVFIEHGEVSILLEKYALDPTGLAKSIREKLKRI